MHRLTIVRSPRPGARATAKLDELATEAWNPEAADLDLRSTAELVELMNAEDASVPEAVAAAGAAVASAIDAIADRLEAGGRLVYVGAGTSGPPRPRRRCRVRVDVRSPPGLVVALIAGGPASAAVAQEHAEDDEDEGVREVAALGIGPTTRSSG